MTATDLRQSRSERLHLRAVTTDDVDVLYGLNADPQVWAHFPSGVHTRREQTEAQVATYEAAWQVDGLGFWTAWLDDGTFVGIGGRSVTHGLAWNLQYRFAPPAQRNGYATKIARAARSAAAAVRPDLAVVAFLLEHNLASKAVAEKTGLHLAWRGPDVGNPDQAAVRLVYADRDIAAEVLGRLLGHDPGPGTGTPVEL